MINYEKTKLFFTTLLFAVGIPFLIFSMWYIVDIDDLECIKSSDSCTVYSRKAFQQSHIKDFFKISDIVSYRIEHNRHVGHRCCSSYDYYYPIFYTKDKNLIFLNFYSRSYENAKMIAERIMDNRDFEIKGSYYKSSTDRY